MEEESAEKQYLDLLFEHELEAERILLAKAQVGFRMLCFRVKRESGSLLVKEQLGIKELAFTGFLRSLNGLYGD